MLKIFFSDWINYVIIAMFLYSVYELDAIAMIGFLYAILSRLEIAVGEMYSKYLESDRDFWHKKYIKNVFGI